MMRRFGTSARLQAFTRTRQAAKPLSRPARPVAANPAKPAAASVGAQPGASAVGSGSALGSATSTGAGGPSVGPSVGTSAGSSSAARPSPSSGSFTPRLVPEMARGPSTTQVADVVDPQEVVKSLPDLENTEGLSEDWTTSFQGLGARPFDARVIDILMAPVVPEDVEVTPDGLIYLPEIKYRRILNRAFGPGGWGIAPRTKTLVTNKQVTREYGLVCLGRLVSISRGEMDYFNADGVTTAMEGCKSNALMRCCKDLGIASELWDPSFIRQFKAKHCESKFYEKKRRFVWKRKDRPWEYPYNQ